MVPTIENACVVPRLALVCPIRTHDIQRAACQVGYENDVLEQK